MYECMQIYHEYFHLQNTSTIIQSSGILTKSLISLFILDHVYVNYS